MRDGDVRRDGTLGRADRAVKYLLDRIQYDNNLRYYMLGTEAMALLVEAEAARLGLPYAQVNAERHRWLGDGSPLADVVELRRQLETSL